MSVFETIKTIPVGKSYYDTNVFNIEDIFSIIEMGNYLDGRPFDENLKKYIVDVIEYYPPAFPPHIGAMAMNWQDWISE